MTANSVGSRFATVIADAMQDVRLSLRQMGRAPSQAALIVITLALGIGANVTMVDAVDRLLLQPPPGIRAPAEVARLVFVTPFPGGDVVSTVSNYATMLDLEREVASFDGVASYSTFRTVLGSAADGVDLQAVMVSPSFFTLLGVRPALGRLFGEADGYPSGEATGGPALAVLDYRFWQRHFGADSSVIGRPLRIGALSYIVTGIAPSGFRGLDEESPDVWLPMTVTADAEMPRIWRSGRATTWVSLVARLREGATRAAAEGEAARVWAYGNAPPGPSARQTRVVAASAIPGRGPDAPREVKVALWLAGISTLVLLIACANVASLLLARAFVRRREIAIRLALGAARGRLARQMLVEGLMLAVLGGVGALCIALLGGSLLQHLFGSQVAGIGILDARLLLVTGAIALSTGVLVSLAPLAQSVSPDAADALRTGASAGGGRRSHVRTALLGTQATLCMLLLIVAGLFATSLHRLEQLDLGLDVDQTIMARFERDSDIMPEVAYDAMYATLLQRVMALPGVERAALAETDPYRNGRAVAAHTLEIPADELWYEGVMDVPMEAAVDSGFFRTVGARLHGRDFEAGDVRGAPRVAVINEPLAHKLWPGGDAVGQCMLLSSKEPECVTVVGVLQGFWRRDILRRDMLVVYVPLAQRTSIHGRPAGMFVRVSGDPDDAALAIRKIIVDLRPSFQVIRVTPMRDIIAPQIRPWRTAAGMFMAFGAIALLISMIGLYAVVSFMATQRSHEIAVRMALGAGSGSILTTVAGDGLRTVAVGLVVGAVAAFAIRGWIGPLLFQTSATDPLVMGGVGGLLMFVAVLAIVVPTVRALRQNPASLLRSE